MVTEGIVRAAARAGQKIELREGTLITPAARDLARQLGVPLGEIPQPGSTAPSVPAPVTPGNQAGSKGEVNVDTSARRIALGSDHGGFKLKEVLKPLLAELGFTAADVGCNSTDPVDYPVFAARVADLVGSHEASVGIMIDGAGIGSAMVGNKIRGVRAASCHDVTTARNAREHNDANLLTLGGGLIGERLAAEIVRVFLTTDFAGGRHTPRVAMINALDH